MPGLNFKVNVMQMSNEFEKTLLQFVVNNLNYHPRERVFACACELAL